MIAFFLMHNTKLLYACLSDNANVSNTWYKLYHSLFCVFITGFIGGGGGRSIFCHWSFAPSGANPELMSLKIH